MPNNSTTYIIDKLAPSPWTWQNGIIVALLILITFFTFVGNLLIVVAIAQVKKLRTVTNHMILSLAMADLIMGVIVMPFAISLQATDGFWPYGPAWCHLWHSFDVLGSTASILNLCAISLDRYWAVTSPINYPRLMSKSRGCICITVVWIFSAGISFPMIAWWIRVDISQPGECHFTESTGYLVLSSIISFYVPMIVMIIVYVKIYRTISVQLENFKQSNLRVSKPLLTDEKGTHVVLRAHRGGQPLRQRNYMLESNCIINNNDLTNMKGETFDIDSSDKTSSNELTIRPPPGDHMIRKNTPLLLIKRRMQRLSMEHRVAKTLGVVMSFFLLCWLPFFVCNLLFALCKTCMPAGSTVFLIVTWLGYTNSAVNPIIYALSMKDLRTALGRILCSWRPKSHLKHSLGARTRKDTPHTLRDQRNGIIQV